MLGFGYDLTIWVSDPFGRMDRQIVSLPLSSENCQMWESSTSGFSSLSASKSHSPRYSTRTSKLRAPLMSVTHLPSDRASYTVLFFFENYTIQRRHNTHTHTLAWLETGGNWLQDIVGLCLLLWTTKISWFCCNTLQLYVNLLQDTKLIIIFNLNRKLLKIPNLPLHLFHLLVDPIEPAEPLCLLQPRPAETAVCRPFLPPLRLCALRGQAPASHLDGHGTPPSHPSIACSSSELAKPKAGPSTPLACGCRVRWPRRRRQAGQSAPPTHAGARNAGHGKPAELQAAPSAPPLGPLILSLASCFCLLTDVRQEESMGGARSVLPSRIRSAGVRQQ
jgi:hypothetical protein